jgi:hypothetical protein
MTVASTGRFMLIDDKPIYIYDFGFTIYDLQFTILDFCGYWSPIAAADHQLPFTTH